MKHRPFVLARALALTAIMALAFALGAILEPGRAQEAKEAPDVKTRYAKQEVMIPMRDGTRLFTIIYTPKHTSQTYPFLLTRTAYSIAPYGPDNYLSLIHISEPTRLGMT